MRVLSIFVTIGIFLLAACSPTTPEPVTIHLEMSEYVFSPDTIEVKVGQEVTIELVNVGLIEHELMIGRDVMMVNNRPDGYMQDMFADAGVEPMVMTSASSDGGHGEAHAGFMVVLPQPQDKATITFTVTSDMVGEWEMGCFSQEGVHYDAGMVGKFIVSP